MSLLSSDLTDPAAIPYFLWDEPMTVLQLRQRLSAPACEDRTRLLGKVLREARDTDVWQFTTPEEIRNNWDDLKKYLGRRRGFWKFFIESWAKDGLIAYIHPKRSAD